MSDPIRIKCEICGALCHSIQMHIKSDHADWTIDRYKDEFPTAPVLSELAKAKMAEKAAASAAESAATPSPEKQVVSGHGKKAMHEIFQLGKVKGATNARGDAIPITVFSPEGDDLNMVPDIDGNYVYELESLKDVLMAMELNIPLYMWGHAGTGKTTLAEQVCARTQRPALRVQHTVNTEESHLIGQWVARAGETHFEYGPLPLAMINGWTYIADEYDFALASVLSVYQPVLEGKNLVIKEAPSHQRVVKPHSDFRIVATGNTNGSGDETGLYQGTNIQNAANYDRFHMVLEIKYMKPELEVQILVNQAKIEKADAAKLVDFANRVRESYDGSKISMPISPRTLIASAKIGLRKGSYRAGIARAFANKLTKVDREVVDGLAQRIFG